MLNPSAEILTVFDGFRLGEWVYCLHCARVYQVGEFRQVGALQMCPYAECDGDAVIDVFHWSDIAEQYGFGAVPERGKEYCI